MNKENDQIPVIKGVVADAEFVYQRILKVYPVAHHYGNNYFKYSCPVCDLFDNKHQVLRDSTNCDLCGVNLDWGGVEDNVE